ncbi:MAG: DinB family protein [Acidimicrobiia bacterium]
MIEDSTDAASAAGERETLMAFLDHYRTTLARKADGLTEEQARSATCPPSDLTILGLVRHLADVERDWAHRRFAGRADIEPLFHLSGHPDGDIDGDFHPPPEALLADAIDALRREIAAADVVYAAAELDAVERSPAAKYSLRWILIHLVEEYCRHCGHADLIRQAIDGASAD